jgi:hypothetical protein
LFNWDREGILAMHKIQPTTKKNSSSKAFIEHLLKSGTICDIQNPKLVFQNELENCDILNMQSSQLFEEP